MSDRNQVKPRRNYTAGYAPTAAELETHEIAVNWADGIVYVKTPAGDIVSWRFAASGQTGGGGGGETTVITITAQPTGQTLSEDGGFYTATMSVTASASNGGAVTYQWQSSESESGPWSDLLPETTTNGNPDYDGEQSASLSISYLTPPSETRWYRVVVSSAGAASVTSDAAPVTVSPPAPEVSAPLNNYATTSTDATAYAVTASGVTNETYQWQALITDFNYTETWQNLPGKTTAAITLQQSDFDSISYDGYGYVYVAIRCVVTHAGGSLTSNTAHHAQWWISHPMYFDLYTPNTYTYPDNSETIDGIAYSVFSSVSGEGVLITAMDMMNMGSGDYSWFTGDDFQFEVEQWTGAGTPTEAGADWSVIHSTSSRQYASLSYTIPESTGTGYYRVRTTRPWPLTVTDGSASAARGSFSANGAHVKVGWPAGALLAQIDTGGYTWAGSGTLADPFVTTYLRSGIPSIRGNSPGLWTSSNRPAWQISGGGTFNYTVTGFDSADANADHALYKSTDGGATWTLAATLVFGAGQSVSFSVADGDLVEQRGYGLDYQSDTWVQNPTVWLA